MAKIREVYELYGFEPVDQPLIEYTDALGKFLPDQDRPNEGVFSFQDDDEQWLSLRYDLTAPMARFVAENFEKLPKPYRSYHSGWVFRNEKPGPGRFRQFMQFDADTVGTPGVAADAEMCMMMADVMEALGIARGDYVIRVNNRKVLDGVLEAIGLGGDENAGRRLTVLRAIDKLDKFGVEGVRLLLGPGRWDGGKEGEGDFTKGAGLDRQGQLRSSCSTSSWMTASRPARCRQIIDRRSPGTDSTRRLSPLSRRSYDITNMPLDALSAEELAELEQIGAIVAIGRLRRRTASASTPPSSAASNITPARSSRPNCLPKSPTRKARSSASARSAAAGVMTGWSRASAASRCRRPASPSASRG